ncbi:alginate O-acetyltransferase [Bacteroidota bacterium]|nr:alginate O-acetyltransferase [Bacteroidota bacterium]
MAFIPAYIFILAITISVDYSAAILMERQKGFKRKLLLITSLISTAFILFVFKYFNFFTDTFSSVAHLFNCSVPSHIYSILLPIGLSFHTFQSMAYVIEVYRGNQKAEKNFGIYSLYVMFFPQLVAGPIERPQNLIHQFYESHDFKYQNVTDGLKQMAWGFFKKLVIADRLAIYINEVYNHPGKYEGLPVILATIFFAYQIYCDFSGYSDIAIGAARVMGFRLMKNFDNPYSSASVSEFWRRWHISLSSWFRDYLFIPLGGSRVSLKKIYINLAIVFLVSGLWHGANWTFIVWGALHGIYVMVEKYFGIGNADEEKLLAKTPSIKLSKAKSFIKKLTKQWLTFFLVCFAWIFFRADSVTDAFTIITSAWHLNFSGLGINIISIDIIYFSVAGIIILEIVQRLMMGNEFFNLMINQPRWVRLTAYHLLIISILAFGVFNNSQFIYFQF